MIIVLPVRIIPPLRLTAAAVAGAVAVVVTFVSALPPPCVHGGGGGGGGRSQCDRKLIAHYLWEKNEG